MYGTMVRITKPLSRKVGLSKLTPKHLDLRPNAYKSGHMPKPRKQDTIIHEEQGFRVWREKGQKGGWVTVQYRERDGRTVTMKARPSLVKQALEYQASIEGVWAYGASVVRDMPTSFKHVWYATDDLTAQTVKWLNIGSGHARMLRRNNMMKDYKELLSVLRTRNPVLIETWIQEFHARYPSNEITELFNYDNTLENGQYDEYKMMDE